jgi:hypothetical protein
MEQSLAEVDLLPAERHQLVDPEAVPVVKEACQVRPASVSRQPSDPYEYPLCLPGRWTGVRFL